MIYVCALLQVAHVRSCPHRHLLATFPHSGSTWIRSLWEIATGIASESAYREGGTFSNVTDSFGSGNGLNDGYNHRKRNPVLLQLVHRANLSKREPILIKTHYPHLKFLGPGEVRNYFGGPCEVETVTITTRAPESWCKAHFPRDTHLIHWNKHDQINYNGSDSTPELTDCINDCRNQMESFTAFWRSKATKIYVIDYDKVSHNRSEASQQLVGLLDFISAPYSTSSLERALREYPPKSKTNTLNG